MKEILLLNLGLIAALSIALSLIATVTTAQPMSDSSIEEQLMTALLETSGLEYRNI